jgi:hypothetical protein
MMRDLEKEAGVLVDIRQAMAARRRKWGLRAVLMAAHMAQPHALASPPPIPTHLAALERFGKSRKKEQATVLKDYINKLPDPITKVGTVSTREKQVRRAMQALSGGHDFHGSGNLGQIVASGKLAPGHRNTFGTGVYYTQDKPLREYWNDTFAHGPREGGFIVPRSVSQSTPAKFFSEAPGAYRVGPAIPLSELTTMVANTQNPKARQALSTAQRVHHVRPMTMDALAEAASRLGAEAPVMSKSYQSILKRTASRPLVHRALGGLERAAMGARALMGRT